MPATTEVKPDIKQMRAVLDYIKEHPDQWDQRFWAAANRRPITYNFAGLAVVLDGAFPLWGDGHLPYATRCRFRQQYPEKIRYRAQRILGLSDTQADALFLGTNTLRMLELLVKQIESGELR